jgi:hypothetical protein
MMPDQALPVRCPGTNNASAHRPCVWRRVCATACVAWHVCWRMLQAAATGARRNVLLGPVVPGWLPVCAFCAAAHLDFALVLRPRAVKGCARACAVCC